MMLKRMTSKDAELEDTSKCPGNLKEEDEDSLSLFDLPWEDVLFRKVLPLLPLTSLFKFRTVSWMSKELITNYFSQTKSLNLCQVAFRMTPSAFHIMTDSNNSLEVIVLRNAKDWLSGNLFKPLIHKSPKLIKVDLTNCQTINNVCLQALAGTCKNLKELYLRDCHWVSVEGIKTLSLNCKNLEKLDLTGCWEVNDSAVVVIAIYSQKLRYLSVAKIYGLTDHAISSLAKSSKSLVHLNVQGCWRLSDDSIRDLAEYSRTLKVLQVRECRDVTEGSLARLRVQQVKLDVRPPPHLRNLNILHTQNQKLNVQI
ncbi:F-box/LRR-repeat protein 15-like [Pecten maximus]|uniref:F-box/LRR-repeat protein 15-like n=1 Tax=Pecten maximus TaxID=6579 RepID=UPI0014582D4E|nr:F-box/LRR-repeat protein 15-like [Pecten maximus]